MKTLLAIINDPKESKGFIRYLAGMAIDLNAQLHLLYSQNPNSYAVGTAGTSGAAFAQVQQNMEGIAEAAKEVLAGHIADVKKQMTEDVIIDYSTEIGVAFLLVKELVESQKADMLVLEGHKEGGFWTENTNDLEMIGIIECPTWIIPHGQLYKPYTNILYATDYREEDVEGLKKLTSLTKHSEPSITALHITDSIDFEEKVKKEGFHEMLQKKVAYDKLSLRILKEDKADMTELLNKYAMRNGVDLIVVLKENQSFFKRIFYPDPMKKVVKESIFPVLIYHEK